MGVSKVIINNVTKVDLTSDTVTPETLMSSYTAHDKSGTAITGIATGGTVVQDEVIFIDYDGTVLYTYTPEQFLALTNLPTNPSHTGLTAQGWNWTLSDAKTHVTNFKSLVIGQNYVTSDGKTRLYITLDNSYQLSLRLALALVGTISIDWGDGSSPTTVTGTGINNYKVTDDHTYSLLGNYTITITPTDGSSFGPYGNKSPTNHLFEFASTVSIDTSTANDKFVLYRILRKVELGTNLSLHVAPFYNSKYLEYISVPAYITSIPVNTFYYCNSLKAIVIPSGVTVISSGMFQSCIDLEYCSVPLSVTQSNDGSFSSCLSLKHSVLTSAWTNTKGFYWCKSIKKVIVPSNMNIGSSGIFSGCSSLVEVVYKPSTNSNSNGIVSSTFSTCDSLEKVTIPNNITLIGSYAFEGCHSLASIDLPTSITSIGTYAFHNCDALKNITLPSSITSVADYCFDGCTALKSINIPSNVTSIGQYTFRNCGVISKIELPSSTTSIGQYAFYQCYNLKKVTCASNGIYVGQYAFQSCSGLKEISRSNSSSCVITYIGQSAFYSCLQLIRIPPLASTGITSIGNYAFYSCYCLESIELPNTVTAIGAQAFYTCRALTIFTIPSSVTSIGASAFAYCNGLKEIHFQSTTPPTLANSNAFNGLPTWCKIYVPSGYLSAYTSATNYPSSSTYTYLTE